MTANLILTMLLLSISSGCVVREQTFIIPAKLKNSWISVEYENAKCPKLEESQSARTLIIPESGYLCTSSGMWGVTYDRFFVAGAEDSLVELKAGEQIRNRHSISQNEGECRLKVEEFWFGGSGSISHQSEFVNKHHPECMLTINTNRVP